jgi:DNA-binding beta-propeller fold protein YncE
MRLLLLPAAALAFALLASPAGADVVVVLNSGEDTVSLLSQQDYAEKSRVAIGREPHHLMLTPDKSDLIVANALGNELVFLDPATGAVNRRLRNISDPYQIGFSPDRKWFVATSLRLDRVDVYSYDGRDLALAARLPLAAMPSHIAFSPDSRFAYVTLQGSDRVAAIDLAEKKVAWQAAVGPTPAGIFMTPKGTLVAGIMGKDYVVELDPKDGRILRKVVTGKGAHNVFGGPDGRLYVSNRLSNTVVALDMTTFQILQTYKAAGGPDCIDFSADGKEMWVTARWLKTVYVFDVASGAQKRAIPVGRSPHGIYVHHQTLRTAAN